MISKLQNIDELKKISIKMVEKIRPKKTWKTAAFDYDKKDRHEKFFTENLFPLLKGLYTSLDSFMIYFAIRSKN